MKIGIDISQIAFPGAGVANYTKNLVESLLRIDKENEYILFGSSLRRKKTLKTWFQSLSAQNAVLKIFQFPPTLLDFLWNRLHILPIETLIGKVDIFLSSDWTQPPTRKAKEATILYDLSVYKHPQEMSSKIVSVQKRRLKWVKRECEVIFCISQATKKDALEILGIEEKRLSVVYPGGIEK